MATYDLHSLGWHSFQQLCLTIAREVLEQTIESYLDTNDGGRDGGFAGTWKADELEVHSGQFVIQCKFTGDKTVNLSVAKLSDEIEKAARLVASGRCDIYILMSNAGLSGKAAEYISAAFENVGVKKVILLGSIWICQQIDENKRLRMLVPRVYGLGDLSQILDERAYAQARVLLESMRQDLAKVVLTETYTKAASAIEEHGFVLLIGEPAAGKTTIASLLAMAAIDQWDATPMKLDEPSEVVEHWNPDERSQFFWVDDAFGVTQYESHLVHSWNRRLVQIKAMVANGARVVMTSRDYIYNRARNDLKGSAFPLLKESQVVVDVHNLSTEEKEQILYNHLKLGRQKREFLTQVKPFLADIAKNERFVPEVARRLAGPVFTRNLTISKYSLAQFVENQEGFLTDLLQSIDDDSKASLALIYMRKGYLESPIKLSSEEQTALDRLSSTEGGCRTALTSLNDSLVQLSPHDGQSMWTFKHPTIGDAYAKLLARDPELLDIFLVGSSTETLLNQVTCGDTGYENAIVLGPAHFETMMAKLTEFTATERYKSKHLSQWMAKSSVRRFLAFRCDAPFLELYVEKNPDLIREVSTPGLMLSAVSAVDVAVRLHEFGLFPENARLEFVETVSSYALAGEDLYGIFGSPSEVFTANELEDLKQRVRSEVVPRLGDIRLTHEQSSGSFDNPEEQMQPFYEMLDILESEFPELSDAQELSGQRQLAEEWVAENSESSTKLVRQQQGSDADVLASNEGSRSIFDDVDA